MVATVTPAPSAPDLFAFSALIANSASGLIWGSVGVPHRLGEMDPIAFFALGPATVCAAGSVGPGITWFGTTAATAELPASAWAWLAVDETTIAFSRLVEASSRPPPDRSWANRGFCWAVTAERLAADRAPRLPFCWCKITMY